MPGRQEHQQEVHYFLQKQFAVRDWKFSLPHGSGMETYFVEGNGRKYFVKVGAPVERYIVMADLRLTPPVLTFGQLASGASIMVQPFIAGRSPSRRDYRERMEPVAGLIRNLHSEPRVQQVLPPASSNGHQLAGSKALGDLRQKWEHYKGEVPEVAGFVDASLDALARRIEQFSTSGLVASHNDICNANWLFTEDGKIYLLDLESMSMDDPACDMGALLWWYYPTELRRQFLQIAGYAYDDEFRSRMQVRMAIHCLNITLPREQSFDSFHPDRYEEALEDFRAILSGEENPQGYDL